MDISERNLKRANKLAGDQIDCVKVIFILSDGTEKVITPMRVNYNKVMGMKMYAVVEQ